MYKRITFLFLAYLCINGCQSSGSGTPIEVPNATMACSTATCAAFASTFNAVITISASGCHPDTIDLNPIAISPVTATCNNVTCSATATSWVDANGNPVEVINSTSYDVCGWIDFDNNAVKNSNDAFSESTQVVTSSTLTITDWSVTYSSRRKIRKSR